MKASLWPRETLGDRVDLAATRGSRLLHQLGRHQLGAFITTVVDFGVMIAVVQALHARPVLGTIVGASAGAVTNFLLGRYWIFDPRDALARKARHQAQRYAFVSAASLCLNALGVRLLAEIVGVQYVLARTIVAACVSLLWNFPMHRHFVFSSQARASSAESGDSR